MDAARIPNINLIQDTPTSPDHVPRPIYTYPELPRVPEEGLAAPELDRCAEGLQVDPNGPYPQPTTREIETKEKHWLAAGGWTAGSQKPVRHDDAGLIPYESSLRRRDARICGVNKRKFIIIASIVAIVIVCVAIGGGVGGYYASKKPTPTQTKDTPPNDNDNDNDNEPTVTSGTTGMAQRPCSPASVTPESAPQATPRGISNPYNSPAHPSGAPKNVSSFDITCRRGVPNTGGVDGEKVGVIARFITYDFTSCMDHCSESKECMGVVYGANLTDMVADGGPGGNCLLKDARWEPVEKRPPWKASALKRDHEH